MKLYYHVTFLFVTSSLMHEVGFASPINEIAVDNPSFESSVVGGGVGPLHDWEILPGTGIFVERHNVANLRRGAFDGDQHATFHQVGHIYQDLDIPWQADAIYEVRLSAAHRSRFGHGTVEFGLWDSGAIGTDLATAGYIDVQELWQGSGNPNTILNTFVEPDDPRLNVGVLDRGAVFQLRTSNTPPAGNLVAFTRFFTGGGRVQFDNYRVSVSSIPEPASGLLFALCCFGLIGQMQLRILHEI